MLRIEKYTTKHKNTWNDFLTQSNINSFLFQRHFIEYHHQRFTDHSLLIFNEYDQLDALFPANEKKSVIYSHQGLSYGGVIFRKALRLIKATEIFKAILHYFKEHGFEGILYKKTPNFYYQTIDNQEKIILFRLQAKPIRQAINTVIDLRHWTSEKMCSQRKRDIKKAQKTNIKCVKSKEYKIFWNKILIPNLRNRHAQTPTHSLEEISHLSAIFPHNIQLITSLLDHEIIGGTILFIHQSVVHAQYISCSEIGRKTGALSLLFHNLIEQYRLTHDFFSFGISTENNDKKLNIGLHRWKEGFGGSTVSHDFYYINVSSNLQL